MAKEKHYYSPRSILLSCFDDNIKNTTLAVELYEKWYSLFLIFPDGIVKKLTFPGIEHINFDIIINGPSSMNHIPNPVVVFQYCKENNIEINAITRELIIGRWEDM